MRIVGRIKNFKNFLKALFATLLYGYPAKELFIIGVTGTDGKTTTAHLIYEILKKAGLRVGLISTIGAFITEQSSDISGRRSVIDGRELDTGLHTTMPPPFQMQKLLNSMVRRGITHVVLEATSHGLDQHRALGCNFRVGVLTNITHEHTDYHGSFENYKKVKARLFRGVRTAILNRDDANFDYIRKHTHHDAQVVTYSTRRNASLWADEIKLTPRGMRFSIQEQGVTPLCNGVTLHTKLVGTYNVANILAAASVARSLDIDWQPITKAVDEFSGLRGRMEVIDEGQDFGVIVDFAHTPNSLEKVLTTLKKLIKGRLIAVFGSAGERDKRKRFLMAEVSSRLADYTILTAEDPRTESIHDILEEMEEGAKRGGGKYEKIPERGEAIAYAVQSLAQKGDTVVVCGKGHERSMAYGSVEHPWSDQEAARDALAASLAPAVVMAGGKGKRINANRPKILYEIAGRPMIAYTLQNLRRAHFGPIIVVVGYKAEEVKREVGPAVGYALQKEPLGTGHAVKRVLTVLGNKSGELLVMNGDDSAFYRPQMLQEFLKQHRKKKATISFMTVYLKNPGNLGVVKKNKRGRVVSITDFTAEGKPGEVNAGTYAFDVSWLRKNIGKVKRNEKGEYFIIDLIDIAVSQGEKVETFKVDKSEWYGVNTEEELKEADRAMRKRLSS